MKNHHVTSLRGGTTKQSVLIRSVCVYLSRTCFMKNIFFLFFVNFLVSLKQTYSQDKITLIKEIRKEVSAINKDSAFKKVILNNEEFLGHSTDGGGELTGYYKAGQLKKIVSWVGLSSGNEIFEFYFKDGKLIFVYEQFNSFLYDEKKQILRMDKTEITFAGRYYFKNNHLIDYVTTGHNRFENDTIDVEKTLLSEMKGNRNLLERKKNIK